jgi:two-component system invasion response regulator UvrY
MKKISVMIVDDLKMIRETLGLSLEKYKNLEIVGLCGDGQKAIELATEKHPNVVLLDINMEPTNGFEVLKKIRKFSPGSKVIALSMHSQPQYVKKMLRMGAKGYVTKNSPRDEMLTAIDEVSKGHTYICEEAKKTMSDLEKNQPSVGTGINSLTEREIGVSKLLVQGHSGKEIANALAISTKTVEVHRHNILKKLNLKNTASLATYLNALAVEL